MRRADRLFQIVQILRNKRLVTAHDLAERLQVSQRTIYRDIQDLSLSGVPVEGEAGVGYHLRYSLDVPPLMFHADELEALVVAARMLKVWGGKELGKSAKSALDKIEAVIPEELQCQLNHSKLFTLRFDSREDLESTLDICHQAVNAQHYLKIHYVTAEQQRSIRKIKPLGLFFWGKVWTLTAWCKLREDFRSFRLDRIEQLDLLPEQFSDCPGETLKDYMDSMRENCSGIDPVAFGG